MKVTSKFLQRFHLDFRHMLLTGRGVQMIRELFDILDVRNLDALDDVQFLAFVKSSTDLSEQQAYSLFDMFDVDASGFLDFDEFYLLVCMLIAIKDKEEKRFLHVHSRTCFELLDEDGGGSVGLSEFVRFSFVFSISKKATKTIFKEFDIDGSKELDYEEFKMFTLAALDKQAELDKKDSKWNSKVMRTKLKALSSLGAFKKKTSVERIEAPEPDPMELARMRRNRGRRSVIVRKGAAGGAGAAGVVSALMKQTEQAKASKDKTEDRSGLSFIELLKRGELLKPNRWQQLKNRKADILKIGLGGVVKQEEPIAEPPKKHPPAMLKRQDNGSSEVLVNGERQTIFPSPDSPSLGLIVRRDSSSPFATYTAQHVVDMEDFKSYSSPLARPSTPQEATGSPATPRGRKSWTEA